VKRTKINLGGEDRPNIRADTHANISEDEKEDTG